MNGYLGIWFRGERYFGGGGRGQSSCGSQRSQGKAGAKILARGRGVGEK